MTDNKSDLFFTYT